MYYIFVCLSKVFQRTIFLSCSRFSGKAFAKVRRFFFPSKFFRKFFSKKFLGMTSRGLSLSRSLASLQGKILGCSAFESLPLFTSLSFSAALPLESGCKGTHFFRSCNFYRTLFSKIFEDFYKSLKQNVLQDMFFRRLRKRTGTCLHYVFRAGACTRTYMYTKKKNMYAQRNLQLHTRRNRLNNRHATGKTGGDTEESIHTWAAFFQRAEKKLKRIRFWPPQKIHGLPDLFPGNSHFYASRRTETSQELPILCHPKDINFPDMTIFMPIGRRKK